jgi:hypothetical protein
MHVLLVLIAPVVLAAEPPTPVFREQFFKLCDAVVPVLDDTSRRVPFYQDSYAVRALAVAYDMSGKRQYLDACRRWSARMVEHQARMTPQGAYYMNYGRKPGEPKGDWYVGDSSSIALAVLATAVRCPDAGEKARFLNSVTAYARLVMDNYVMPCGGITDGLWSRFDGEWWCSTGIFGSLAFVLYDQTGDPAYLKVGLQAIDWLNRQRFENASHIDFKEAAPSVLMYVFEAYSAGMPHLQRDPIRWAASQGELQRAMAWMAANQPGRNPKSTWKYESQWGSKLGGLPFHLYVWSRFMPQGPAIASAADKDLADMGKALEGDRSKLFQLCAFAMMSYAERLSPGSLYRTDPTKPVSKARASAEIAWKAGVATAKITPSRPMWMSGYAARKKPSEGTNQDLFAKAIVLEDKSGSRVAIVTLDLIGVLTSLRDSVEKQVAEKYKLVPQSLLLAASHTHCGPEYRDRKGSEDAAHTYHKFLEETLVRIVGEALKGLAPAELTYGHARAGFAMNRRRNYQLPKDDINAAKAPNPDGPVDHDVPVLSVADAAGQTRAVLFGYACHNTTLGFYEFCGDYAGYAQQYLQEDRPGVTAMFIAGCGADQNPYPRSTVERARQHGRSLATAVEAALFADPRPLRGPLSCAMEKIRLVKSPERPALEYPIQVIRLGSDVTLVALASEVVVDYSLRLKRQLARPPAMVWVAGYSNGYFGYIPSDRVLEEGGYEADGWKTPIEEPIVAKALELERRLAGSKKK